MGEWDPRASSENADIAMTTVSILFVYNTFWEQTSYITEDFCINTNGLSNAEYLAVNGTIQRCRGI